MFGPDTNLIFGAIQMAAVTAAFTGGAVYLLMRRKRKGASDAAKINAPTAQSDLEERVRVLERIATDPATRLAEEFEQLEKPENQTEERV
ncbi:MAG: hypothetical protein AAFR64_08425 [Pseudomonadota bacterium]